MILYFYSITTTFTNSELAPNCLLISCKQPVEIILIGYPNLDEQIKHTTHVSVFYQYCAGVQPALVHVNKCDCTCLSLIKNSRLVEDFVGLFHKVLVKGSRFYA